MKNKFYKSLSIAPITLAMIFSPYALADNDTSRKELSREWSQAITALGDYTVDKRDQAVEKAEVTLQSIDKEIEQLEIYNAGRMAGSKHRITRRS